MMGRIGKVRGGVSVDTCGRRDRKLAIVLALPETCCASLFP